MQLNNTRRTLIIAAALTTGTITPMTTMTGCESTQIGSILNSKTAMDLLSPLVKDAANSYIANLKNLTNMLGGLDNLSAVMDFLNMIEPTINDLKSAYNTLASTSPEERKWLWEAFGPKLNNANKGFLNQSEDLTNNSSWSRLLNPVLDKVELFQSK